MFFLLSFFDEMRIKIVANRLQSKNVRVIRKHLIYTKKTKISCSAARTAQQQPFGFGSYPNTCTTRIFSVTLCYTLHAFSRSNRLYVSVTQSQSQNIVHHHQCVVAAVQMSRNGIKVVRWKFCYIFLELFVSPCAPVSIQIVDGWCNIHINCMLDRHFIECRFGWMNPW